MNVSRNPLLACAAALTLVSAAPVAHALTYNVKMVQTNGQGALGLPDYVDAGFNGGEFTVFQNHAAPAAQAGFFDISSYSPLTSNLGNFTNDPSFQTFCVEIDEYVASPVVATLSTIGLAILGGANTNAGDFISAGTAYLYRLFARGELPNYFNGSRQQNSRMLQQAFWFLENEISNGQQGLNVLTNPYLDLLYDANNNGGSGVFGSLAGAQANNAAGGYGVYVLNMMDTNGTTHRQDQLYYNEPAQNTPEGGSGVMLMGLALGGLGFIRRVVRR